MIQPFFVTLFQVTLQNLIKSPVEDDQLFSEVRLRVDEECPIL